LRQEYKPYNIKPHAETSEAASTGQNSKAKIILPVIWR
jgi:hypothetical protein